LATDRNLVYFPLPSSSSVHCEKCHYYLGVTELGLNVWQRRKQPDIEAQSKKRLQSWIDQAKATAAASAESGASPRVAIVTGTVE
jgi:hypothetical protein